jgi:hypothetical protein
MTYSACIQAMTAGPSISGESWFTPKGGLRLEARACPEDTEGSGNSKRDPGLSRVPLCLVADARLQLLSLVAGDKPYPGN